MTPSELKTLAGRGTVFCGTCCGEFDEAEWDMSPACPECEEPKRTISEQAAAALRARANQGATDE